MLTAKSKDIEETKRMEVELGELPLIDRWMYNQYESLVVELDWLIQVS